MNNKKKRPTQKNQKKQKKELKLDFHIADANVKQITLPLVIFQNRDIEIHMYRFWRHNL